MYRHRIVSRICTYDLIVRLGSEQQILERDFLHGTHNYVGQLDDPRPEL
jgi:hypothetical protein